MIEQNSQEIGTVSVIALHNQPDSGAECFHFSLSGDELDSSGGLTSTVEPPATASILTVI